MYIKFRFKLKLQSCNYMKEKNKKEVVCVIPARSGSKGIPNKNILNLGGHPMIAWTIEAALNCSSIDRIIVSTDSEEYKQIAIKYGAEVPFLRPKKISRDNSTDLEFFNHTLDFFINSSYHPSLMIHLRPTTPLRDPKLMDNIINNFDSKLYTSLRSVHRMKNPIEKSFRIENNILITGVDGKSNIESTNNPRQNFKDYFIGNGYIDILIPEFIRKSKVLYGDKCSAIITEKTLDLDDIDDFQYLNYKLEKEKITFDRFKKL